MFLRLLIFTLIILGVVLSAGLILGILSAGDSPTTILPGLKTTFTEPPNLGGIPASQTPGAVIQSITILIQFAMQAVMPLFSGAFYYWLYMDLRRVRGLPAVNASSTSTKVFLALGIALVAVFIAAFLFGAIYSLRNIFSPERPPPPILIPR